MKYELLLLELLKLLKQTLPCRPRNRQLCKKKIEISPFKWEKAAGRRPLRHVTLLLQCTNEPLALAFGHPNRLIVGPSSRAAKSGDLAARPPPSGPSSLPRPQRSLFPLPASSSPFSGALVAPPPHSKCLPSRASEAGGEEGGGAAEEGGHE